MSSSSFSNTGGGSSFKYYTSKEKESLARFEVFNTAFTHAKVTRLALHANDLSTKNPVPYLHTAYSRNYAAAAELHSTLPDFLKSLLSLQDRNGKWIPSTAFYGCFGTAVPDPPVGVSAWRWCCALALALIRRYPEYIGEVKDAYKRGLEWSEPGLIEEARKNLPPREAYYELDEELVKQGKWKASVQRQFDQGGYQNFLPASLKKKRSDDEKALSDELSRLSNLEALEDEKRRLAAIGVEVNDPGVRSIMKRQIKQQAEEDAEREAKLEAMDCKRQPLLGIEYQKLTKTHNFEELKERWQSTCSLSDEMKRLKVVEEAQKAKAPWDGRSQAVDSTVAKRQSLGAPRSAGADNNNTNSNNNNTPFDGPSPLAQAARERATLRMQARADGKKKKLSALEKALRSVDRTQGFDYSAAKEHKVLQDQLDRAQALVVTAILAYEEYVSDIRKVLEASSANFRAARVVAARQQCFDELTAMLGHPQVGRKGYTDWRGRDIKGVVLTTAELVESVGKWREAVLAAQGKLGARDEFGDLVYHGLPLPFMWNGKNVLLEIPYGLHFLTKSKDFVGWYGTDFTFDRNPFMVAIPLDKRPQTPIKDTRDVEIDGVVTQQVSEHLNKIATKQKAYLARCNKITDDGGSWWPAEGGKAMSESLRRRVKSAEKVLLLEEANYLFGKRTLPTGDDDDDDDGGGK